MTESNQNVQAPQPQAEPQFAPPDPLEDPNVVESFSAAVERIRDAQNQGMVNPPVREALAPAQEVRYIKNPGYNFMRPQLSDFTQPYIPVYGDEDEGVAIEKFNSGESRNQEDLRVFKTNEPPMSGMETALTTGMGYASTVSFGASDYVPLQTGSMAGHPLYGGGGSLRGAYGAFQRAMSEKYPERSTALRGVGVVGGILTPTPANAPLAVFRAAHKGLTGIGMRFLNAMTRDPRFSVAWAQAQEGITTLGKTSTLKWLGKIFGKNIAGDVTPQIVRNVDDAILRAGGRKSPDGLHLPQNISEGATKALLGAVKAFKEAAGTNKALKVFWGTPNIVGLAGAGALIGAGYSIPGALLAETAEERQAHLEALPMRAAVGAAVPLFIKGATAAAGALDTLATGAGRYNEAVSSVEVDRIPKLLGYEGDVVMPAMRPTPGPSGPVSGPLSTRLAKFSPTDLPGASSDTLVRLQVAGDRAHNTLRGLLPPAELHRLQVGLQNVQQLPQTIAMTPATPEVPMEMPTDPDLIGEAQIALLDGIHDLAGRDHSKISQVLGFDHTTILYGGQPLTPEGIAPLVHTARWAAGVVEEAQRVGLDLDTVLEGIPASPTPDPAALAGRIKGVADAVVALDPDAAVGPPPELMQMEASLEQNPPVKLESKVKQMELPSSARIITDLEQVTPTALDYDVKPEAAATRTQWVGAHLSGWRPYVVGRLYAGNGSVLSDAEPSVLEVFGDDEGRLLVNMQDPIDWMKTMPVEVTESLKPLALREDAKWKIRSDRSAPVVWKMTAGRLMIDVEATQERGWVRDLWRNAVRDEQGTPENPLNNPIKFLDGLLNKPPMEEYRAQNAYEQANDMLLAHNAKAPTAEMARKMSDPNDTPHSIDLEHARLLREHAAIGSAVEVARRFTLDRILQIREGSPMMALSRGWDRRTVPRRGTPAHVAMNEFVQKIRSNLREPDTGEVTFADIVGLHPELEAEFNRLQQALRDEAEQLQAARGLRPEVEAPRGAKMELVGPEKPPTEYESPYAGMKTENWKLDMIRERGLQAPSTPTMEQTQPLDLSRPPEPIPLGLSRAPVINESLEPLSETEFEAIEARATKTVDELEKQYDEMEGELTPEFRQRLAQIQDEYDAVVNEATRRRALVADPADLAADLRRLDLSLDSSKVEAIQILRGAQQAGQAQPLIRALEDISRRSPDHAEIIGGQINDLRQVVKSLRESMGRSALKSIPDAELDKYRGGMRDAELRADALAYMATGGSWSKKPKLFAALTDEERFQAMLARLKGGTVRTKRQMERLNPKGWANAPLKYFGEWKPTPEQTKVLQEAYGVRVQAWKMQERTTGRLRSQGPKTKGDSKWKPLPLKDILEIQPDTLDRWAEKSPELYHAAVSNIWPSIDGAFAEARGIGDTTARHATLAKLDTLRGLMRVLDQGQVNVADHPSYHPGDPVSGIKLMYLGSQSALKSMKTLIADLQRPMGAVGPRKQAPHPLDIKAEYESGRWQRGLMVPLWKSSLKAHQGVVQTYRDFETLQEAAKASTNLDKAINYALRTRIPEDELAKRNYNVKVRGKNVPINLGEWVGKLRKWYDKTIEAAEKVEIDNLKIERDGHRANILWVQSYLDRSEADAVAGLLGGEAEPDTNIAIIDGVPTDLSKFSEKQLNNLMKHSENEFRQREKRIGEIQSGAMRVEGYVTRAHKLTRADIAADLSNPYSTAARYTDPKIRVKFLEHRTSDDPGFESWLNMWFLYAPTLNKKIHLEPALRRAKEKLPELSGFERTYFEAWIGTLKGGEPMSFKLTNRQTFEGGLEQLGLIDRVLQMVTGKDPNKWLEQAKKEGQISRRPVTEMVQNLAGWMYFALLGPVQIGHLTLTEYSFLLRELSKHPPDLLRGLGWAGKASFKAAGAGLAEMGTAAAHFIKPTIPRYYSEPSEMGVVDFLHEMDSTVEKFAPASTGDVGHKIRRNIGHLWAPYIKATEFHLRATTYYTLYDRARKHWPEAGHEMWRDIAALQTNDNIGTFGKRDVSPFTHGLAGKMMMPLKRFTMTHAELLATTASGVAEAGRSALGEIAKDTPLASRFPTTPEIGGGEGEPPSPPPPEIPGNEYSDGWNPEDRDGWNNFHSPAQQYGTQYPAGHNASLRWMNTAALGMPLSMASVLYIGSLLFDDQDEGSRLDMLIPWNLRRITQVPTLFFWEPTWDATYLPIKAAFTGMSVKDFDKYEKAKRDLAFMIPIYGRQVKNNYWDVRDRERELRRMGAGGLRKSFWWEDRKGLLRKKMALERVKGTPLDPREQTVYPGAVPKILEELKQLSQPALRPGGA